MKKFRIFSLLLVMVMCLSLFAGCNKVSPPKNAVELVRKSAEAMKGMDNYHMDVSMSLDMYLDGEMEGIGMVIEIPMSMKMSIDQAGTYKHGTTDMEGTAEIEISFMGESEKQTESLDSSSEMYAVLEDGEVTTYVNEEDAGWVYSVKDYDKDKSDMSNLFDAEGDDNIFSDAEMEKDDDKYVVSLKLKDALSNEDFVESLEGLFSELPEGEFEAEEFAKSVGDAKIVYTFDAETLHVISIEVKKVELDDAEALGVFGDTDFDGVEVNEMSMSMDIKMKFSKFGEIDEDCVKVPKKVKKSAVLSEDDSEDYPIEDPSVEDPSIPSDPTNTDVPIPTEPAPSHPQEGVLDNAHVFVYNGHKLDIPADYTVFLEDGWYAVEDGEYSSFLCMENSKYEYITLYLYTNDGSGTEESVAANGCDGFELGIYQDTINPPELSFAGIKFGDSREYVISVLGESEETYSSHDFEYFVWDIVYSGKECSLQITLTGGEVTGFDLRPNDYF